MTKIALITDTHFGARGDSQLFANHFRRFYEEVFFPKIEEEEIETVVHLGDIVDHRKYINYLSAHNLKKDFITPCRNRGLDLKVIIGNHDTFYKNTNRYNAMRILYSDIGYPEFYDKPTEVKFGSTTILFMPWICPETYEDSMKIIESTKAQILFGHLEIQGFEMYKGQFMDHGLKASTFNKFDLVFSGHYHHKSTQGNITYLGAPYDITWNDFNDPRGFHIFDTDTRELEYIENPIRMFHKVEYSDDDGVVLKNQSTDEELDVSSMKDKIVKLIVKSKTKPEEFDLMYAEFEKSEPSEIKTIEDTLNLNVEEDIVSAAEDTRTILKKYIAALDLDDPKPLENLFDELYDEALAMERDTA